MNFEINPIFAKIVIKKKLMGGGTLKNYHQENFILVHFNFKLIINFALKVIQNFFYLFVLKNLHKNSKDVCIKIIHQIKIYIIYILKDLNYGLKFI